MRSNGYGMCWENDWVNKLNHNYYEQKVILGNYTSSFKAVINTITCIVKCYIYAVKCTGKWVSFINTMSKVYKYQQIEKRIDYQQNKIVKFNQKNGVKYQCKSCIVHSLKTPKLSVQSFFLKSFSY